VETEPAIHAAVILTLGGIALAWFALAVIAPGWLSSIRRTWSDWSGILIIGSGLAVVGFGMISFLGDKPLSVQAVALAAYDTVQLFTLNIDESDLAKSDRPFGWLAAASAAIFAVLFAFGLISALFRDSLDTFRLVLARNHVVVCGAGRNGRQIIEDVYDGGRRRLIVAIEREGHKTDDIEMRSRGVITVVGDATKPEVLHKAGVARAGEVFVVTGSDEQNIEVALEIAKLLKRRGRWKGRKMVGFGGGRARCFVHIVNRDLAEIFRVKTDEIEEEYAGIDLEVFSAAEAMARSLLESMVCSGRPLPAPDQVVHVVLIGFGRFGKSLALHLAEWGHFANQRRLRMTIADQNIATLAKPFLARHQRFCRVEAEDLLAKGNPWVFDAACDEWSYSLGGEEDPGCASLSQPVIDWVCNAGFETLDDVCDERFVGQISKAFSDSGVWPAVVLCFDDDHMNFTYAERIREIRDRTLAKGDAPWPIFVRMNDREELASLLNRKSKEQGVYAFSSGRGRANYADIADSWTERLAQLLHLAYADDAMKRHVADVGGPNESAERPVSLWDRFRRNADARWNGAMAYKPSNRSAAVHGIVKLATLGWMASQNRAGRQTSLACSHEQLETLAAMEHYRWVSERLLAGWSFGREPDEARKRKVKKSPHLIPYGDSLETKDNDRQVVQTLLAFCRHGEVGLSSIGSPSIAVSGDKSNDG